MSAPTSPVSPTVAVIITVIVGLALLGTYLWVYPTCRADHLTRTACILRLLFGSGTVLGDIDR